MLAADTFRPPLRFNTAWSIAAAFDIAAGKARGTFSMLAGNAFRPSLRFNAARASTTAFDVTARDLGQHFCCG